MHELELKFALTGAGRARGRRIEGSGRTRRRRVWSCYYDTPDGALMRERMAVRVRRNGERWLLTLKADTGDRFQRFEWEVPIAGDAPELDALPPADTPQGALARRSFAQWAPLFETDFERSARRVDAAPRLAIEVARDVGELRCGERREPIAEIELECLEGSRAAFFAWALAWAERERATLLMPSKHERGLRLAARIPRVPAPAKAAPAAPGPDVPADVAAAEAVVACVLHFCGNLEPVLASDAPEGVHQLRVALRRLRGALRFFELRGRDDDWAAIEADARALASAAGPVRDLDVLETGLLRELRSRFPGDAAIETLARSLVDAREAARGALRARLSDPSTTRFVLRTLATAERIAQAAREAAARADRARAAATAADASVWAPASSAGRAAAAAAPRDGEGAAPADGGGGARAHDGPASDPDADARGIGGAAAAGSVPEGTAPEGSDTDAPSVAPVRFGNLAAARVHGALRRVRRRVRDARDEADWHRVRIAVKALRYGLGFAADAMPAGTDVARASAVLADWQERLGAGQDLAAARGSVELALSAPGVPTEAAVRAVALVDAWRALAPQASRPARRARRALRELSDALGSRRGD